MGALLSIALAACSSEPTYADLPTPGEFRLVLPEGCEHWRPRLIAELADLQVAFERSCPWPAQRNDASLQLLVAADPTTAAEFMGQMRLSGDPAVARTFPERRVALVPLPRRDALLWDRPAPPQTWLATFRHEAVHLLSLDRPGLRDAPLWFQEGFAEWLAVDAEASPFWSLDGLAARLLQERDVGAPLLATLDELPSEARLEAWSKLVDHSFAASRGDAPWLAVASWRVSHYLNLYPAGGSRDLLPDRLPYRGREFDPPGRQRSLMLASYPGESVTAIFLEDWLADSPLDFTIQVGRSGMPEAGLLLRGRGDQRLRIRFGRYGGLGAYLEPKGEVTFRGVEGVRAGAPIGAPQSLRLEERAGRLVVSSSDHRESFPLHHGLLAPPFTLEFYVRDGALTVSP